jgi:hypothetical protein
VAEDFQLMALLEALSGETVAVKVSELPSTRLRDSLLRDTPVTLTVEGLGLGLGSGCSAGPQPTERHTAITNKMDKDTMRLIVCFMAIRIIICLNYKYIQI